MPPTNKRAKDIERARLARQETRRRQAQAKQRRYAIISGVVVVVLVITGLALFAGLHGSKGGASASPGTSPSTSPSASTADTATPTPTSSVFANPTLEDIGTKVCHYIADTNTKTATSPGLPPDTKATGAHTLTVVLSEGTVVVKLDPAAPCTVNSFIYLASKGFFNNTICHRLVTSGIYVLQCGDPTGTGSGGPGYTIPDENLTGATYPAGTLAMANTGAAHTGGSQFFFVYQDSTGELGPDYTPFGTVTSGLNVLTAIAAKGTNNANGTGDGAPNEKVTIKSFTIS